MPAHALAELDAVAEGAGPLAPHVQLLRGTSLMAQARYGDAIESLREAVRTVPAPYNRLAWWSLSKCFQHEGLNELAGMAAKFAESPPKAPENAAANIFVVIFTPKKRKAEGKSGEKA